MKILQQHTIRPTTTAHLAQTMTLLSLAVDELKQQIDSELASNPALEMLDERRCPLCQRALPPAGSCPVCSAPKDAIGDDSVVYISPREDFFSRREVDEDDFRDGMSAPEVEELPVYVLRQVASDLDKTGQKVAAFLLMNLDEDGLLKIELFEAARYFNLPLSQVESVHQMIMRADPVGVAARNPQEALLVQLEALSETRSLPDLYFKLVSDHMDLLSRRQYASLARACGVTLKQVRAAVDFIQENLNPYPARAHWGPNRSNPSDETGVFHQPDVIITCAHDGKSERLFVEVILPISGTLRVNPFFKQALKVSEEDRKEDMRTDLEKASLFVKCLQQRNHTMLRLMQRIVGLQRLYILHGDKYLQPVTRAQLARELEVHESTISRAVANKAVQLPNGKIVPMASFFDRSLNIRTVIKNYIHQETRPLSDTEIAFLLARDGYEVARRTVAKYRAMEGILPAHLRTPVPLRR